MSETETLCEVTYRGHCHVSDLQKVLNKPINCLYDPGIGSICLFDEQKFLHFLVGIDAIRKLGIAKRIPARLGECDFTFS